MSKQQVMDITRVFHLQLQVHFHFQGIIQFQDLGQEQYRIIGLDTMTRDIYTVTFQEVAVQVILYLAAPHQMENYLTPYQVHRHLPYQ